MMKKITLEHPESKSADLIAENIEKLKSLFPELVTEGPNGVSINIDVLNSWWEIRLLRIVMKNTALTGLAKDVPGNWP